ncbi:YjaG family protein [Motiliproteus sp. SC1-56]|uniref:YjaG family protein n=1 Tax=Motiliproteus sp. SC1-56 TaxID=2799565 RepID=UPI001A906277|nr:YjaG family protein [Motiliproteus sp. SC1-56]
MNQSDHSLRLGQLGSWQLGVFSAAIAERLFPNYALFARLTDTGDAPLMRQALDKVWDRLANRGGKVNFDTQLERVDGQIPDPEAFDMFGVYPALDAAVALYGALNQMVEASAEEAQNLSELALTGVETYLEITADVDLSDEELVRHINTHPLMEQEREFQETLLAKLNAAAKAEAGLVDELRTLAANEGVSNIGISDQP